MNKGEIQSNIERLRGYKKENLSKADEARAQTEQKHYRLLAKKNDEAIQGYEEKL